MYTRRGVTTTSMRPPRTELQESNTKKILIDGRMCSFYPLVYVEECSITLTFSKLNGQYITIKASHFSKRCMKLRYQSIQHTTVANEREIGRATCNTQVRFYAVIKEVARQSKQAHPAPPVASQKQLLYRKKMSIKITHFGTNKLDKHQMANQINQIVIVQLVHTILCLCGDCCALLLFKQVELYNKSRQ